jgi:hypothetical protein
VLKVAGEQDHEVNYQKDKMKVSSEEIKKEVGSEGNSREK